MFGKNKSLVLRSCYDRNDKNQEEMGFTQFKDHLGKNLVNIPSDLATIVPTIRVNEGSTTFVF